MTRSSVLTSSSVRTGISESISTSATPATRRLSVPTRRPARSRPAAGIIEYGPCGPGVSRVEHEGKTRIGFGQMVAIAVTTAAVSLGLIGVANMRADTTSGPQPTSTSIVQDQLGASATG